MLNFLLNNGKHTKPRIQLIPQEQKSSASILKGEQHKLLPQPSRADCATASPASGTPVPGRNSALFPPPWWLCGQTGGAMHKSQERHFHNICEQRHSPRGEKEAHSNCLLSPVLQSSSSTRCPHSNLVPYSAPTEATFRAILQSWTKTCDQRCFSTNV